MHDGDDDDDNNDSNDDDDNCPSWAEVSLQRIPGLLRPVNALWSLFLAITITILYYSQNRYSFKL